MLKVQLFLFSDNIICHSITRETEFYTMQLRELHLYVVLPYICVRKCFLPAAPSLQHRQDGSPSTSGVCLCEFQQLLLFEIQIPAPALIGLHQIFTIKNQILLCHGKKKNENNVEKIKRKEVHIIFSTLAQKEQSLGYSIDFFSTV